MDDVIDSFLAATSNMASPPLFRLWSAISMVSSTMSRRVWTCFEDDMKLFGNTFIMLVARPGIGKSRALDMVGDILHENDAVAFSGDEATREEVVEHMGTTFADRERALAGEKTFAAILSEFATFMPKADTAWMQALARIWDCPRFYERRTKHMGNDYVHYPYFTLLAGVQPLWFADGFPRDSYEMGLPARLYLVFADQKPQREFFRGAHQRGDLGSIRAGLERVKEAKGQIEWDREAQRMWVEWMNGGQKPRLTDPLLFGYATRRDVHAAKLALISAVSSHPQISLILPGDLRRAWEWLFEMEAVAPKALMAAGGNTLRAREEMLIEWVRDQYGAERKPIKEADARAMLGRMVLSRDVEVIVNEMILQGRLKALPTSQEPGKRLLVPGRDAA